MKKNSFFVYVILSLFGGTAGYTFVFNTVPQTFADSTPPQTLSVEPSPSVPVAVANVTDGLSDRAPSGDDFLPQQANSVSFKAEQTNDNIAQATIAQEPPPVSPPGHEQYPSVADQSNTVERVALVQTIIELVQTIPVRENLDKLTQLLLEDPAPDVRRTVLERLASGDTANDISIVNTLDTVLRNDPDASVIRTALDYYKQLGEQYAYNACLALTQRDDLSAFALAQAYSFLVDNELIGPADASNYVMQSPSFAKLGADERDYVVQDVLAQSTPTDDLQESVD